MSFVHYTLVGHFHPLSLIPILWEDGITKDTITKPLNKKHFKKLLSEYSDEVASYVKFRKGCLFCHYVPAPVRVGKQVQEFAYRLAEEESCVAAENGMSITYPAEAVQIQRIYFRKLKSINRDDRKNLYGQQWRDDRKERIQKARELAIDLRNEALTAEKKIIPDIIDITKLPRFARVAFAARCAKSVQSIFLKNVKDKEQISSIKTAISIAEKTNVNTTLSISVINVITKAEKVEAIVKSIDTAAAFAATAAINAATASNYAIGPNYAPNLTYYKPVVSVPVYHAVEAAAEAAKIFSNSNSLKTINFIWKYYHLLAKTAKREEWDDNTYVPPSSFGKLPKFKILNNVSLRIPKKCNKGSRI